MKPTKNISGCFRFSSQVATSLSRTMQPKDPYPKICEGQSRLSRRLSKVSPVWSCLKISSWESPVIWGLGTVINIRTSLASDVDICSGTYYYRNLTYSDKKLCKKARFSYLSIGSCLPYLRLAFTWKLSCLAGLTSLGPSPSEQAFLTTIIHHETPPCYCERRFRAFEAIW